MVERAHREINKHKIGDSCYVIDVHTDTTHIRIGEKNIYNISNVNDKHTYQNRHFLMVKLYNIMRAEKKEEENNNNNKRFDEIKN